MVNFWLVRNDSWSRVVGWLCRLLAPIRCSYLHTAGWQWAEGECDHRISIASIANEPSQRSYVTKINPEHCTTRNNADANAAYADMGGWFHKQAMRFTSKDLHMDRTSQSVLSHRKLEPAVVHKDLLSSVSPRYNQLQQHCRVYESRAEEKSRQGWADLSSHFKGFTQRRSGFIRKTPRKLLWPLGRIWQKNSLCKNWSR